MELLKKIPEGSEVASVLVGELSLTFLDMPLCNEEVIDVGFQRINCLIHDVVMK